LTTLLFLFLLPCCNNSREIINNGQSIDQSKVTPISGAANTIKATPAELNHTWPPIHDSIIGITPSSSSLSISDSLTEKADKDRWNIYHPDPQHLWNRVFHQLYRRTTQDGREYGWDSLDPLLWRETTHLLEETSYRQTVELLDEFLTTDGEYLIADPLKRALFQRDIWAVFDWVAFQTDNYPDQRSALQVRLAQIMRSVALTEEEILSLPNNYETAVLSNRFSLAYQETQPNVAFLPFTLFQSDSEWVYLGRTGGPLAMTHTEEFPFFGRSVFLVFIRVPGGRVSTLEFLDELNTESHLNTLPIGTEMVLVRQMLLVDDKGNMILSPIVESVQIRHFSATQVYDYAFRLNRPLLFSGSSGGFLVSDGDFLLFRSHGIDLFLLDNVEKAQFPELCIACHGEDNDIQSILSYSRSRFSLPDQTQPVLLPITLESESQTIIEWKHKHQTWQLLKSFWD
jgi:hypothetical protein